MNKSEYESKAKVIEDNLGSLRHNLDNLVVTFIEIACLDITSQIHQTVEEAVLTKESVTIKNKVENIKKMKEEIKVLQEKMPSMVKDCLCSDGLWPHKLKNDMFLAQYGNNHSLNLHYICEAITKAWNTIIPILTNYGYFEDDPLAAPLVPVNWSENMNRVIDRYAEGLKSLCKDISDLNEINRKLESIKAREIWEEA